MRNAGADKGDPESRVGPLLDDNPPGCQQHAYPEDLRDTENISKVCGISQMRERLYGATRQEYQRLSSRLQSILSLPNK